MSKPSRSLLASWPCFCQKVEGKFDDWGHQWHCGLKILEGCRNIFFFHSFGWEPRVHQLAPAPFHCSPPMCWLPHVHQNADTRNFASYLKSSLWFQNVAQTSSIWIWRTENFSKQSQVLTSTPGNPSHFKFRLGSSNGSQHTGAVTDTGKNTDYPCKHQGNTQIHTIWWFTVQRAQEFLDRNKSCSNWHSQCTRIRQHLHSNWVPPSMRILRPHQFLLCKLRAVLNFPPWRRSFALDIMRSHLHAVPRKIMKNLSKYTSSSYLCCSISTTITTLVSKFKHLWDPLGWTNRTTDVDPRSCLKWPQFEASAVCWKDQNDSAQARRPCHFGAAKLTWQLLANHNMFTYWQQTNEGHWQFKQSIDWPSTQGHGHGWKTCSLHSFTQTPHKGLQGCQNNYSDRIYQLSKIGPT